MALADLLVILMFFTLFAWLLTGYPVAFTLAGTSLLFAAIGLGAGILDPGFLELLPDRIFGIMGNELLLAVPLFIAMGVVLEKSRVAEDLLVSMGRLFGPLRGGLGISVTLVGALLAASTGIVGATVVTMGLLSLPTMLDRGYDRRLASGAISAAGTLGQIIPPSIVLILLADVLSSSYQQAQRELGVVSPEPLSVGELFAGALIPGIGLVVLYLIYQVGMAWLKPETSPAIVRSDDERLDIRFFLHLLGALVPPIFLIIAVLGSILAGVATPTEAAAVGAIGAVLLGAIRLSESPRRSIYACIAALAGLLILGLTTDVNSNRLALLAAVGLLAIFAVGLMIALWRVYKAGVLLPAMRSTVRISTMIFTILIGAALFSLVFRGLGGDVAIEAFLGDLPGGSTGALILVMVVMFLLGFFLDFIEITFVVVPIVAPVLFMMDIDPVWLGVLMAVNLQTSFLTPPFGFALFYLRGVAPESVATSDIYRGVIPFVIIQLTGLLLLSLLPGLATWLPHKVFG